MAMAVTVHRWSSMR